MGEIHKEKRERTLTAQSPAHDRPPVLLHLPASTLISHQLCQDPEVDLVLVLAADEYHADVTIAAANAKKHVLVEKPMCLLREEAEAIADAAKNNEVRPSLITLFRQKTLTCARQQGVVIFVGTMRRYATAFERMKEEVQKLQSIHYVTVRDIIGDVSLSSRFAVA